MFNYLNSITVRTRSFGALPTDMDNWRVKFLAADCALVETNLRNYPDYYLKAYLENCVDVAAGERAEIRLSTPYTFFNVTNWAKFENIEFTGEDLFADAKYND